MLFYNNVSKLKYLRDVTFMFVGIINKSKTAHIGNMKKKKLKKVLHKWSVVLS